MTPFYFRVDFVDGSEYIENHPSPEEAAYWSAQYQRYSEKPIKKITVNTSSGEVTLYELPPSAS